MIMADLGLEACVHFTLLQSPKSVRFRNALPSLPLGFCGQLPGKTRGGELHSLEVYV